jgi:hypothetical protein
MRDLMVGTPWGGLQSVALLFDKIGCEFNLTATKSVQWDRGFIVKDGITYGRVAVEWGEYQWVKWYARTQARMVGELNTSDFVAYSWYLVLKTGVVLTKELWDLELAKAVVLQEQDYQAKVAARRTLAPKKRKALQYKSIHRFITFEGALTHD